MEKDKIWDWNPSQRLSSQLQQIYSSYLGASASDTIYSYESRELGPRGSFSNNLCDIYRYLRWHLVWYDIPSPSLKALEALIKSELVYQARPLTVSSGWAPLSRSCYPQLELEETLQNNKPPVADSLPAKPDLAEPTPAPFRFMDLPVELRCLVYEELVVVGKVYFKDTENEHAKGIRYDDKAYFEKPHLKLFLVCRQIHNEAEPIYLSKNLFVLPVGWQFVEPFNHVSSTSKTTRKTLFSQNALRYLKNLSFAIDMDEHWSLRRGNRRWKIETWLRHIGEDQRLNEIHRRMLDEISAGDAGQGRTWRHMGYALCSLDSHRLYTKNKPGVDIVHKDVFLRVFEYVEIDFTNAYCPLGCCRPVWTVNHNWIPVARPAIVDIVGLESEEEIFETLDMMEKYDGLGQDELSRIRFRKADDASPWARWKFDKVQRYVPGSTRLFEED